ncbi:MAG TPA: presqualene diphosphate synthase HpnD [Acetobacteraceae bacterium]|nr:presqualene diphosphate synthase HpnD [Acetobacteraceae bacterium]
MMEDLRATAEMVSDRDSVAVTAIVREAGTSFYRGMRVLPKERRTAMYALYAFCRIVDDIADDDSNAGPAAMAAKRAALDRWRARIEALYRDAEGGPDVTEGPEERGGEGPVIRVLAAAAPRYGLRREDFLAIIDGMQMDAETPIVAPDLATLDLYCDRVAAAVGRLSVRIFGDSSPAADRVANALGRALQLTNILRDLAEDAERGRLYLPREWLEAARVPPDHVAALRAPGLPLVCARTAALAHSHFERAAEAMRACDARAMRPARLMKETYAAILARLERRGWKHLDQPVSVPGWQKLWLALRYGLA